MPAWIVEIQIPTSSAASQQEFDIGNLLFARPDMAPLKLGIKLQAIISDFILQKGDQSINRIIDSIVSNVCKLWDVSCGMSRNWVILTPLLIGFILFPSSIYLPHTERKIF